MMSTYNNQPNISQKGDLNDRTQTFGLSSQDPASDIASGGKLSSKKESNFNSENPFTKKEAREINEIQASPST